jgi:hypothetical protein
MSEDEAALRWQLELIEVLFSLPMRNKNKAADQIDQLFFFAPLNPTLVYIMMYPYDSRPFVGFVMPRVIHLKIDPI